MFSCPATSWRLPSLCLLSPVVEVHAGPEYSDEELRTVDNWCDRGCLSCQTATSTSRTRTSLFSVAEEYKTCRCPRTVSELCLGPFCK